MKKFSAAVLCVFVLGAFCGAQTTSLTKAVVPVARTVSSILVLELDGKTLGGVTIETPFFEDHPLAMAGLLHGDSALLLTGSALAVRNSQAGGPVIQVATPVWDVSGLVTLDPALATLADLKGKTLALPLVNGPLDLQTKALLKAAGLEGQVKIEYAEPAQSMALLLTRKVDVAGLPEPLVSSLVLLKGAHEIATYAQLWAPLNNGDGRAPQVSLLAKRTFAAENPGFLRALITELRKVVALIQADPKSYAAKYAQILNLPVAVVARGLANTKFDLPGSTATARLYASYLALTGETKPLAADFYFQE